MNSNSKTIILGFYGESDSGKTTLVEGLIHKLTEESYHVAAVKKTNQSVSIDSAGKDTNRYSQAGATLVVFSTQIETAFLDKVKMSEEEIITNIQNLGNFDFIFVEGANEKQIAKIRLGNIAERENTLFTYDGNFENLLDIIKNRKLN